MTCPACKEEAEFEEAAAHMSRCQNCGAFVNNEDIEPSEDD
jgi:ribosomal protein L37AE/L43A